jgi:hypothetical protein
MSVATRAGASSAGASRGRENPTAGRVLAPEPVVVLNQPTEEGTISRLLLFSLPGLRQNLDTGKGKGQTPAAGWRNGTEEVFPTQSVAHIKERIS